MDTFISTYNLNPFTLLLLAIIFIAFGAALCYINYINNNEELTAKRHLVEYLPLFISTLGVLGTFIGITLGLLDFDSGNLDKSIPQLLDGLKTAFYTSILGMLLSSILSWRLNNLQDNEEDGITDLNKAEAIICQAVQQMSKLNTSAIEHLVEQIHQHESDRKTFHHSMCEFADKITSLQSTMSETLYNVNASLITTISTLDSLIILQHNQESTLISIKETTDSMIQSIGNIEETTNIQSQSIKHISNFSDKISSHTQYIGEIADCIGGMSSTQDEINEQIQKLKDILDAEVDQIEHSMDKTNKLLERKFDEFTALLKKSNTEALVEVMKQATEEFQKQMNTLIGKLIQENFDQLNQSVKQLNQWQQENKDMISSLTNQYFEMSQNFEATSASLTRVKDDTATLVGEGGKLRNLVDALNKVILEDEHFIQVTKGLQETADLSKSNMISFNEATNALNEWVRKQRNFVDSVQVLILKLDELNKIRDYGDQFWQSTKTKMEEGIGIISNGSQTLNQQLTSLDRQFYSRLSATLAELDNCITKMVDYVDNRK